jgi:NAD(P)-dependent dehydrogenase (short-subunit alcohol dehydrogenase family)
MVLDPANLDTGSVLPLSGKVAFVTGGSRGLGREIVRALAREGADVVIASRKLESCQQLAEEIRSELGRRALALECHVGRWPELDAVVARAYAEFGRIDILVNNAGMSPLFGALESVSEELWDKVLSVNLKGPFRLSALIGARMVEQGGGNIVNISSAAATHPTPDVAPYAAAKAGLNALTVAFAHALGPTVRVNTIAPGTFYTDVSEHWDMDEFAQRASHFALRRGAEPAELAGAVLYLVSDAASYTTGALLAVDGGYA